MCNGDVGGKVFEVGSTEFYVRGRGYIKTVEDIENVPLKTVNGTSVYIRNVGTVHVGPDLRLLQAKTVLGSASRRTPHANRSPEKQSLAHLRQALFADCQEVHQVCAPSGDR